MPLLGEELYPSRQEAIGDGFTITIELDSIENGSPHGRVPFLLKLTGKMNIFIIPVSLA